MNFLMEVKEGQPREFLTSVVIPVVLIYTDVVKESARGSLGALFL